jgi:amino acid adenylation domain-containing protein
VLEIGCGTGLLLQRLAPAAEVYWGTDFSATVLDQLQREVTRRSWTHVTLRQLGADDFSSLPTQTFDLVILNSVVQYFPSAEFLLTVLRGAARCLRAGGRVFVGDVRNLDLLHLFHLSLVLERDPTPASRGELRQRVQRSLAEEKELLVSPAAFAGISRFVPELRSAEIAVKPGAARNEMTTFRYDAVLHTTPRDELVEPEWIDVDGDEPGLASIERVCRDGPRAVGMRRLANARLWRANRVAAWLDENEDGSEMPPARRWAELDTERPARGVDPDDLYRLAHDTGRRVTLTWTPNDRHGRIDACFVYHQGGQANVVTPVTPVTPLRGELDDRPGWTALVGGHGALSRAAVLVPKIRRFVEARLPAYMVPASFVTLDRLPLTRSGKLDRRALPAPDRGGGPREHAYSAPETSLERVLCQLWGDVLGLDRVGTGDDFFALGGHSLLATRLVSRIRDRFGLELPLRSLFDDPTVSRLGRRLVALGATADAAAADAPGDPSDQSAPVLQPIDRRGVLALSFPQQRLWFLHQLEPADPGHNTQLAVRLRGPLDRHALTDALGALVRRHEVLRTTFRVVNGQPTQQIADHADVPLEIRDLTAPGAANREALVAACGAEQARAPFDLEQGPLLRACLIVIDPVHHILFLTIHHIAADGWSFAVLIRDAVALYRSSRDGTPPSLPVLDVQYADFAHWQRATSAGARVPAQRDYWIRTLGTLPDHGTIEPDHPRRHDRRRSRGAHIPFDVDPAVTTRLRALGHRHGATLFMTLASAFAALLHRYGGHETITLGTPIANRTQRALEDLIGCFLNVLVLRLDLGGNPSFAVLLERVRQTALDAYANQDYPFEALVDQLRPARDLAVHPLFQVMFALQNTSLGSHDLPGLEVEPVTIEQGTSKFDLSLLMEESGAGLHGVFEYDRDLFEDATIEGMVEHLQRLLDDIGRRAERPVSELSLLPATEERTLARWEAGPTLAGRSGDTVVESILRRGGQGPDEVAVRQGDVCLTYLDLVRRSDALAHRLLETGVAPGDAVALLVSRSVEMLIGIIGILRAGGAYVPLDPSYPAARLELIRTDSRATCLVHDASGAAACGDWPIRLVAIPTSALETDTRHTGPLPDLRGDDPAYVIYTSGSTGAPKGVVVTHHALLASTLARQTQYPDPVSAFLLLSSHAFDSSVAGIFWTLSQGGCLVLPPPGGEQDVVGLRRVIADAAVSHLLCLPSLYALLLSARHASQLRSLRTVVVAGETCPDSTRRTHQALLPETGFHNEYGPTEGTVWATVDSRGPGQDTAGPLTIGRPRPGHRVLVLDRHQHRLPIGRVGEIAIAGEGLARGYLGRATETAERWVPDPSGRDGARLFRTGDLAKWDRLGQLRFVGRLDAQVKVRGYRIEPAEVEAVLSEHPALDDVVVHAAGSPSGETTLVAYGQTRDATLSRAAVREWAGARLPGFMVPDTLVLLSELPRLANGKVDRRHLPAPEHESTRPFIPARDPLEFRLVDIWERVLGTPVGIHDNFFDLGGHSLLAVRLVSEIHDALGHRLPISSLFLGGAVADQADLLRSVSTEAPAGPIRLLRGGPATPPLYCVHQAGGNVLAYFHLARRLGSERTVYGIEAPGLEPDTTALMSIEAMATRYLEAIRQIQPSGPYAVAGHSLGGLVAFEIGRRLEAEGDEIALLALMDVPAPRVDPPVSLDMDRVATLLHILQQAGQHYGFDAGLTYEALRDAGEAERYGLVRDALADRGVLPAATGAAHVRALLEVYESAVTAATRFRPAGPSGVAVTLFVTEEGRREHDGDTLGWDRWTTGRVTPLRVPGDHHSMLLPPHVDTLARTIEAALTLERT